MFQKLFQKWTSRFWVMRSNSAPLNSGSMAYFPEVKMELAATPGEGYGENYIFKSKKGKGMCGGKQQYHGNRNGGRTMGTIAVSDCIEQHDLERGKDRRRGRSSRQGPKWEKASNWEWIGFSHSTISISRSFIFTHWCCTPTVQMLKPKQFIMALQSNYVLLLIALQEVKPFKLQWLYMSDFYQCSLWGKKQLVHTTEDYEEVHSPYGAMPPTSTGGSIEHKKPWESNDSFLSVKRVHTCVCVHACTMVLASVHNSVLVFKHSEV